MRHLLAGLVAAIALTATACGSGTPTEGSVTMETVGNLANGIGAFTVTEGADILGCSAGTVLDTILDDFGTGVAGTKELTCESGDEATFTMSFTVDEETAGPGDRNGTWSIDSGTGSLAELRGSGSIAAVISDDFSQVAEALTGEIRTES